MQFNSKEDKIAYLKEHKDAILADKMSRLHTTDSTLYNVSRVNKLTPRQATLSTEDSSSTEDNEEPEGTLAVSIVCNTAWFIGSYGEVFTDTAYDSSLKLDVNTIPHIHDHLREATAHVGDVQKLYTKKLPIKKLGYDAKGETTALVMDSIVREDYNEAVYKFYKNGKINQHSIGVYYNDVAWAVNNSTKDYVEEKAIWDEYYPKIINKKAADDEGYFYIVRDCTVRENSCVLFGSNPLTPTLSSSAKKTEVIGNHIASSGDFNQKEDKPMSETLEQKYITLQAEHNTLQQAINLQVATAVQEERQRCEGILKAGDTFGVTREMMLSSITKGRSLDDVTDRFTDFKALSDSLTAVKTGGLPANSPQRQAELDARRAEDDQKLSIYDRLSKAADKMAAAKVTTDKTGGV